MPDEAAGIKLLKMWLCFHMKDYPLHKVCFCPSVTVEKLNETIDEVGIEGVKKIDRFNQTTPLHMLAMNPHASAPAFARLFVAWGDGVFKMNSQKETPIDCARKHNLKGLLQMIKGLCMHRNAMASGDRPTEEPCTEYNIKKRKMAK